MNLELSHKIARIISTLFIPPTLTLLIFIYLAIILEPNLKIKLIIISAALIFGFILPILMFVYLRKQGMVKDDDATIKEERTIPFFISIIFCTFAFTILLFVNTNLIIISVWFCYILNTALLIIINKYWKISAHAIGVAAPMGVLTFVTGLSALPLTLLLVLIVGWSRIKLKVHTKPQVITGSLFGFILTYLQLILITEYFI